MTEHPGSASNPVPARPSPESVELLRRTAGARRMQESARARGPRLHLFRLVFSVAGLFARLPKGVTARWARYGVRGRLVTADNADPGRGIVLWLHGGGFISGSPKVHQGLGAEYSRACGLPVFLPRYRLAPEHPFPAAADDVLAAYRALLDAGFAADTIRVGGDSSGGALAVGLLGDLGRAGLPLPAAVVLLSPVLDLTVAHARACDAAAPDPWSSPDFIERTVRAYAGQTPLSHPRLDLLAADLLAAGAGPDRRHRVPRRRGRALRRPAARRRRPVCGPGLARPGARLSRHRHGQGPRGQGRPRLRRRISAVRGGNDGVICAVRDLGTLGER